MCLLECIPTKILYLSVPVGRLVPSCCVFSSVGVPTAPDITMLSASNRTVDSITIKADLQQPVYGSECIQNYTVIARADREEDVSGDSNSPNDLFVLVPGLSVCPRQYTFTASACSPMLGCSDESPPKTHNVTDGKCTCLTYILSFCW